MSFGPHEIISVVFLAVFVILLPPSAFLWIKYIRAGFPWRYGFWGATLLCVARIGASISELIWYSEGGLETFVKGNYGAYIAYIVLLSIGYIGLMGCFSALLVSWAENNIGLNPRQEQITGKIGLLNLVAIILDVVGITNVTSDDANKQALGNTLLRVGTLLFLALTVVQAVFLAYAWSRSQRFSRTLALLTLTICFLFVRIIYSVYSTFHRSASFFNLTSNHTIGYLVGPFLMMEVCALVIMLAVGYKNVNSDDFRGPNKGVMADRQEPISERHQQQYNMSSVRDSRQV